MSRMYEVRLYENNILARTRFKVIALIELWGWRTTYGRNVQMRTVDS